MGWSGTSSGPLAFSWQAAAAGNSAAMRSSASMRWMAGGFRLPPFQRRTASERFRFQRQRLVNMANGGTSTACWSTSPTVAARRKRTTSSRGKECWGPSDSTSASSLAAACSSKSNVTHNRLRRANPKARLSRAP